MAQEKINYRDIMDLGFTEVTTHDSVYFDEHGFDYAIINKEISKSLYFDWEKETKLVSLFRTDKKGMYIKAELPIRNLHTLTLLNDFFCKDSGPRVRNDDGSAEESLSEESSDESDESDEPSKEEFSYAKFA